MKCRSTSFFTFISDGSAVFFDDPFANIETKPSAAFFVVNRSNRPVRISETYVRGMHGENRLFLIPLLLHG